MARAPRDHAEYVQRVREQTRRYVEELFADNERLRTLVASVESQRATLEKKLTIATTELDHNTMELAKLTQQIEDIQQERERFLENYIDVEQRNNNLANLYVATYRLHGTLDRDEVLTAIEEIVVNLIGSEEFAIFGRSEDGSSLELIRAFGVDDTALRRISVGSGPIGSVALTGLPHIGDDSRPGEPRRESGELTACIPLRLEGQVTGAVAVFGLLPQKPGLEPIDLELFDLLGSQAAIALHRTAPYPRSAPSRE